METITLKFKWKCPDCGEVVPTGIANIGKHISECPEGLVTLISGTEVKIVKRKNAYAESSKFNH